LGLVTLGLVNYQINMKYDMKTGITETGIAGVGTRDAGTSEFSNLKTRTLETGITGGFPNISLNCRMFDYLIHLETNKGCTPKQPVSKHPVMKKPNLASTNTSETKTASFKTTKIHNAYIQNAQCQKAQFFVSRLFFYMRTKLRAKLTRAPSRHN
jgi:hypothetical protein